MACEFTGIILKLDLLIFALVSRSYQHIGKKNDPFMET